MVALLLELPKGFSPEVPPKVQAGLAIKNPRSAWLLYFLKRPRWHHFLFWKRQVQKDVRV
jgi:hypothetical protein